MSFDKALESIKSVRLTGGIFGKTTLLLVVLSICAAAVSIKTGTWWIPLVLMLPVIGISFYALKRCFDFAERNPQAAIMDGADLLIHERLIHEMKGNVVVPIEGVTVDHPQPQIEAEEVAQDDPAPQAAIESSPNKEDS